MTKQVTSRLSKLVKGRSDISEQRLKVSALLSVHDESA